MRPTREEVLMEVAAVIAKRSTCNRVPDGVGAVLERGGRIIATGYAGAPAGMPHCSPTVCDIAAMCTRTVSQHCDGRSNSKSRQRITERIKLFFGGFVRRGSYLRFAERLRPDQRSFLMPGGSYGERPERWVAFAKTRPEVWAIVPFLGASNVDGSNIPGILSQPEIRAAYVAAGLSLVGEQS